jgi:hypothetical protein
MWIFDIESEYHLMQTFNSVVLEKDHPMKNTIITCCLAIALVSTAFAQEEVDRAAVSACACLKEIQPETLSSTDLKLEMLGCVTQPIDKIAEELTAKGKWADSLTFSYMGKVGKAVRAMCPEQYERLKKKEIKIDPAVIAMDPKLETVASFSQAVCRCIDVAKNYEECLKQVATGNETELKKRFPEANPMTMIMQLGTDAMFYLADNCPSAASNEAIAEIKKLPAIKGGCDKIVLGEFSQETILGETKSIFTATNLKEYSEDKLTGEYELKWNGCVVTMTCLMSTSPMIKKGAVLPMEIKRGSQEGFLGVVTFGKMKVPSKYKRVK